MSQTAEAIVLAVLMVSMSIWIGGYVAIIVVARVTTRVLDQATRVRFFRALGRAYFWVGAPALAVALVAGGVLARNTTGDGLFMAITVIATALLTCFSVAVRQARRMTRLRQALASTPSDEALQAQVNNAARAAGMLRAALGLLSVSLVVLGSFLAVQ